MWGHTRMEMNARKLRKGGKQLLTVNSVNPSCSSALNFILWLQYFAKLLPLYTIVIEKKRNSFILNEYFRPKPFILNEKILLLIGGARSH